MERVADKLDDLIATIGRLEKWQIKIVERLDRLIHKVGGPAGHGPN